MFYGVSAGFNTMAGSEDSDEGLAIGRFIWICIVCPAPEYCIEALYSQHYETGQCAQNHELFHLGLHCLHYS